MVLEFLNALWCNPNFFDAERPGGYDTFRCQEGRGPDRADSMPARHQTLSCSWNPKQGDGGRAHQQSI